ncbi:hypothetical protein FRB95_009409 [Tulasnella sp. JGI-2019a]|nr:hypothetical protein FRB95_009409 [Tulasnella sp. JGI-2019a]
MLGEELTQMDRITQLQDAIEQLFIMMNATLVYLMDRTPVGKVSARVPIWKSRGIRQDSPEVFLNGQKELVKDLMDKAKQIQVLIDALPPPDLEDNQAVRLEKIDAEMRVANEEYRQAIQRARALHAELSDTIQFLLGNNQAS